MVVWWDKDETIAIVAGYSGLGCFIEALTLVSNRYTPLQAILLQFPMGPISFSATFLTGYLSTRVRNIRLLLLTIFCLPVITGCAMMWKSQWTITPPYQGNQWLVIRSSDSSALLQTWLLSPPWPMLPGRARRALRQLRFFGGIASAT